MTSNTPAPVGNHGSPNVQLYSSPPAQLYALNEGWPFGDGPLQWFCRPEVRAGARAQELHMVCSQCPQSVFCLSPDTAKPGFVFNLELLKSRVADHVLKCHPEAVT